METQVKYEELNQLEKEEYDKLYSSFRNKQISLEDFRVHISTMKNGVALELAELSNDQTERNTYLKARLKNYILIEAFLDTPAKAKEAFDKAMKNIKVVGRS